VPGVLFTAALRHMAYDDTKKTPATPKGARDKRLTSLRTRQGTSG